MALQLLRAAHNLKRPSFEDLVPIDSLGGPESRVQLCVQRGTKNYFAVKSFENEDLIETNITSDLGSLIRLDHPNLLKLYDIFQEDMTTSFVFEFASKGPISVVNPETGKCSRTFSEAHAAVFIQELAHAVQYLHSKNMAHRDIQPSHVLLTKTNHIKLALSLSSLTPLPSRVDLVEGSPSTSLFYNPPETFTCLEYASKPVDVWGLGIVLYAILFGRVPFFSASYSELKFKILTEELVFPRGTHGQLEDLLKSCLHKFPAARITVDNFLNHPWFEIAQSSTIRHVPSILPNPSASTTHLPPVATATAPPADGAGHHQVVANSATPLTSPPIIKTLSRPPSFFEAHGESFFKVPRPPVVTPQLAAFRRLGSRSGGGGGGGGHSGGPPPISADIFSDELRRDLTDKSFVPCLLTCFELYLGLTQDDQTVSRHVAHPSGFPETSIDPDIAAYFFEVTAAIESMAKLFPQCGLSVINNKTDKLIYVSPSYCHFLGRTPEQLIGKPPSKHLDPVAVDALVRFVKSPQFRPLQQGMVTHIPNMVYVRPNGTKVELTVHGLLARPGKSPSFLVAAYGAVKT